MGDSDFFNGYSRSVALDDFDEPSEESEEEMTGFDNDDSDKRVKKVRETQPPILPAYIVWNPLIAEHLLKANGPRLDMRFLIVAVGQRASDVLESVVDIDKLDVNGALFMPNTTHACRPSELANAIGREPQVWTALGSKHSAPDTNFLYTTVDLVAACGLFHTAGLDGRRRGEAFDSYPIGSSVAKQLLDGSFNIATLEQVVIFEILPADKYIGDRTASDLLSSPITRCLKTSGYNGPDLHPTRDLEPPNLISGLSADLLCRCELIRQSAALLACYSDCSLNELMNTTYEPLFRLLSKTIYLTLRFKEEAGEKLRQVAQRSKRNQESDDLANLYM